MTLNQLFSGVAGIAMASTLAAAPAAEAQVRSPVQSSMQPQSTFTPPAGATVYRDNGDGTSTRISPQSYNYQPSQEELDHRAYERDQARQVAEMERGNDYRRFDPVCDGSAANGSAYNRAQNGIDNNVGRTGRRILGALGADANNRIADQRSACLAQQTARPDYVEERRRLNQERQLRNEARRGVRNILSLNNH